MVKYYDAPLDKTRKLLDLLDPHYDQAWKILWNWVKQDAISVKEFEALARWLVSATGPDPDGH